MEPTMDGATARSTEPNVKKERITHAATFEELFDHIPDGIIITDEVGNPVEFNQKAQLILGDLSAPVTLMQWPDRFGLYTLDGESHFPAWDLPVVHAVSGIDTDAPVEMVSKSRAMGKQWITMSAHPLFSEAGKVRGALVLIVESGTEGSDSTLQENQTLKNQATYAFTEEISKWGSDPTKILNRAVVLVADLVGDGCAATLLNITGNRLKVISFHHPKPLARRLLREATSAKEFAIVDAIASVVESGKPLLVPVINENLLLKEAMPEFIGYIRNIGVRSLMVVPIKGHSDILGTLTLMRDRGGHSYTPDDQDMVMDIAYRVGLAIENNVLLNSLRNESYGRISAEKALELSEVRFRSIFTSTSLGIKILDLDGNFIVTNPAFQKMLGYSDFEFFGKPITDFLYPPDQQNCLNLLDKLKREEAQNLQIEHRFLAKDGRMIWVNATFSHVKQQYEKDSNSFIVAISEDTTVRKTMEAEMAEMKSRLNNHIEMERLHLAQELHDGPLQDLYSAIYRIENWGEAGAKVDREKVETLKQDLLKVVKGLRDSAKDLRPQAITSFGLEKAIRSNIGEFEEGHSELKIHLNLAQDKQELPEETRLILFRIYQNSLANVLRHAHASEVTITFSFDAEVASLEVRDNGVGFVLPNNWVELVRAGHFGLADAVERMALLGGSFNVDSKPGQGTVVKALIPIKECPSGTGKESEEG